MSWSVNVRTVWWKCLIASLFAVSLSYATGNHVLAAEDSAADAQQLTAALAKFNRGSALLEQFRYAAAAREFESVLEAMPDWTAARYNLGLAYLNLGGQMASAGPSADDGNVDQRSMPDRAIEAFLKVLETDPDNLPAKYCLGTLFEFKGESDQSLAWFRQVHEAEPTNNFAGYSYAKALSAAGQYEPARQILEQIVARDPGFVSAIHELAKQYVRARQRDQAMQLFRRFRALNADELAVGSHVVDGKYGMAGRYHLAMGADNLPISRNVAAPEKLPVFSPEVREWAAEVRSWEDAQGTIRMPCLAVADIDNDGDLDLLLGGQNDGGEAQIWANDGAGHFAPQGTVGKHVVTGSFGDIDNDGDLDLWLGRCGANSLMLNDGAGNFSAAEFGVAGQPEAMSSTALMADIDSDGDLDLAATRLTRGSVPASPGSAAAETEVWFNNTDGTFVQRAKEIGLDLADFPASSLVVDDVDNDFDIDIIAFSFELPARIWVNDRLGEYRWLSGDDTGLESLVGVISATAGDPDKDGDRDLLVFTAQGVQLFLNDGGCHFHPDEEFQRAFGRIGGTGGQFVDFDNDGDLDVIVADAQRDNGRRGPVLLINQWPRFEFLRLSQLDAGTLLTAVETVGHASCVAADFTGNGCCDLLIASAGQKPRLIQNITPDTHWIAFDLIGKRPQEPRARSANTAIGALVEVKTGQMHQQFVVGGSCGPVSTQPLRLHAGLGEHTRVDWLRIIWPDAILQAELELAGDRRMTIEQQSRKPSSCPYLFVWDGEHYEFVGDFGGVGGLGYLVAPGVYARPDPTEYLPLRNLKPRDGQYVLQSLTPLEEITYFDEAKLVAVDHPLGTQVHPYELMAIGVSPPPFELFGVRDTIRPIAAVDHCARDVLSALSRVDREYAGATEIDPRFTGLARPHFVELDFGDQLANVKSERRLVMYLHGWVEYGYSSTNYAASQASQVALAPSIEVWRDGRWVTVMRDVGYPAGINHIMTIDVTGKIRPTDQKIRVTSNMELYWDEIFMAEDTRPHMQIQEVSASQADLHFRGYPREYSPDGKHPNLCDYENIDRNVGWKLMAGNYTRFGDVRSLLTEADDCFVIMGHGEELTLTFDVADFAPVPDGMQRTFILKTDSFCKDMDLYTAFPTTVEPLPFHGMTGYPYGSDEHYPETEKTRRYRQQFNTRRVLPQAVEQSP
jgi:tetratricopeptide (TPR) repeat protein